MNFHFFYFQLKYKRRVYKMLQMDEKQLKSINSKANHKKFLENIGSNNVDKINKMCVKGLDPNFHCESTGGKYMFHNFLKKFYPKIEWYEKSNFLRFIFRNIRYKIYRK